MIRFFLFFAIGAISASVLGFLFFRNTDPLAVLPIDSGQKRPAVINQEPHLADISPLPSVSDHDTPQGTPPALPSQTSHAPSPAPFLPMAGSAQIQTTPPPPSSSRSSNALRSFASTDSTISRPTGGWNTSSPGTGNSSSSVQGGYGPVLDVPSTGSNPSLPAALAEIQPADNLTPAQVRQLDSMADDLTSSADTSPSGTDTQSSPDNTSDTWQNAAQSSDERFRAIFGDEMLRTYQNRVALEALKNSQPASSQ